jgi:hypothetical protein
MYSQTTPSPPADPGTERSVNQVLVSDVYDRFARLLARARDELELATTEELRSFSIVLRDPATFHADGPAAAVALPPSLTARRSDGGWRAEFDFSTAEARAQELISLASACIDIACRSSQRGDICAFIDSASRATAALAKADLLSYPVAFAEVEIFSDDSSLVSAYRLWTRFCDTDPRYPALLHELSSLRRPLEPERRGTATREWAQTQFQTLLALHQHTQEFVKGPDNLAISIIAYGVGQTDSPLAFVNAPVCVRSTGSGIQ